MKLFMFNVRVEDGILTVSVKVGDGGGGVDVSTVFGVVGGEVEVHGPLPLLCA